MDFKDSIKQLSERAEKLKDETCCLFRVTGFFPFFNLTDKEKPAPLGAVSSPMSSS
jgi:hypothetical protein